MNRNNLKSLALALVATAALLLPLNLEAQRAGEDEFVGNVTLTFHIIEADGFELKARVFREDVRIAVALDQCIPHTQFERMASIQGHDSFLVDMDRFRPAVASYF